MLNQYLNKKLFPDLTKVVNGNMTQTDLSKFPILKKKSVPNRKKGYYVHQYIQTKFPVYGSSGFGASASESLLLHAAAKSSG